jgi:hypothetical protein
VAPLTSEPASTSRIAFEVNRADRGPLRCASRSYRSPFFSFEDLGGRLKHLIRLDSVEEIEGFNLDFLPAGLDFLPLGLEFLPLRLDFLPNNLDFLQGT